MAGLAHSKGSRHNALLSIPQRKQLLPQRDEQAPLPCIASKPATASVMATCEQPHWLSEALDGVRRSTVAGKIGFRRSKGNVTAHTLPETHLQRRGSQAHHVLCLGGQLRHEQLWAGAVDEVLRQQGDGRDRQEEGDREGGTVG